MVFNVQVFTDPSVDLKMLEFLMTLIALSVEEGGIADFGDSPREFVGGGTLMMSICVSTMLFLCYIFGYQRNIQTTPFELAFNVLEAVLQLTAGSLIINSYIGQSSTEASHAFTTGSFCIMNSAVYAADAYFAFVNFWYVGKTSNSQSQPQAQTQPQPADV